MTGEELLTELRKGTPVRWLPLEIIYYQVTRGAVGRRLCVGNKVLSDQEERETCLELGELVQAGVVQRKLERATGITFYRLRQ